jgi:hypothetical protein
VSELCPNARRPRKHIHSAELKIDVEARAFDERGAAVLVVAGVHDEVQSAGGEDAAPEARVVVGLEDGLAAVGERAVAEQEAVAAEAQVLAVRL